MKYIQCTLVNGNSCQVSWIPEKFAQLGAILKLKNNGVWEDGWIISNLGSVQDENLIHDSHIAVKEHRKRTGDALPKNK
jgi:hypothetical protein